jgi:hypothetical protein
VFVEELGTVNLAVDALLHFKNNISPFATFGTVVLREFHEQGIVCRLRALAEG